MLYSLVAFTKTSHRNIKVAKLVRHSSSTKLHLYSDKENAFISQGKQSK